MDENQQPGGGSRAGRRGFLNGGQTILLHFHTYNATDGLNFHVRGGTHVRFNLELDGKPISTDSIFLGADGDHPASTPFTIMW